MYHKLFNSSRSQLPTFTMKLSGSGIQEDVSIGSQKLMVVGDDGCCFLRKLIKCQTDWQSSKQWKWEGFFISASPHSHWPCYLLGGPTQGCIKRGKILNRTWPTLGQVPSGTEPLRSYPLLWDLNVLPDSGRISQDGAITGEVMCCSMEQASGWLSHVPKQCVAFWRWKGVRQSLTDVKLFAQVIVTEVRANPELDMWNGVQDHSLSQLSLSGKFWMMSHYCRWVQPLLLLAWK